MSKPTTPTVLSNPIVMWATHPADQGRIKFIEGMTDTWPKTLPSEGDVLTVPFLVDPGTSQPIAVRVAEIRPLRHEEQDVVAILVTVQH